MGAQGENVTRRQGEGVVFSWSLKIMDIAIGAVVLVGMVIEEWKEEEFLM